MRLKRVAYYVAMCGNVAHICMHVHTYKHWQVCVCVLACA